MKIYDVSFVIGSGADRQRFSVLTPGQDAEDAKKNFGFTNLLIQAISGGQTRVKGIRVNAIVFGADLHGTSLARTKAPRRRKKKAKK